MKLYIISLINSKYLDKLRLCQMDELHKEKLKKKYPLDYQEIPVYLIDQLRYSIWHGSRRNYVYDG